MGKIDGILGYKKEVEILKRVCDFLENTSKYIEFGAKIPKGLLICGKSGVGKTFFAEALIKDCKRTAFDFKGYGRKAVEKIFKQAKKAGNAVLFIDDINLLAEENGDCVEYFQLGNEMEEVQNGEVFVIATADKSESLPKYLLNDVFDIKIELEPPKLKDAQEIYKSIFDGKKMQDDFNFNDFCYFADGWTYAEAERVVNDATLSAVYEGSDKITTRHIVEAGMKLRDRCIADEYDEKTAYHEAAHASAHLLLGGEVRYAAITKDGGLFVQAEDEDKTYKDAKRRYFVGLAGKAGEEVFFGEEVMGCGSDLKKVAEDLEFDFAKLAIQGFEYYDTTKLDSFEFNNRLANYIQANMKNYYDEVKSLIEENKQLIVSVAEKLKEKHYLLNSELHKIYDEYKANKK